MTILRSSRSGTADPSIAQEVLLSQVAGAYHEVAPLGADLNPMRTDLLCRVACLRSLGRPDVSYDDLVVLTGYATSFAYHPTLFAVMYQPPDSPEETERRVVAATGYGWEWLPRAADPEVAWQSVRDTLDSGRPVQARWLDDYVFAGYRDAARPDGRAIFSLGGWSEPGWMTWAAFVGWHQDSGRLGRPTAPVPQTPTEELLPILLGRMVEWSQGDGRAEVHWMREGVFGNPGILAYADDVADAARPPERFDPGWLCCHCVNRQSSGRASAARWLRRQAPLQTERVSAHLLEAARLYEEACEAWLAFRAALAPEGGKEAVAEAWRDAAHRARGAACLRRAAAHERQAAGRLAEALGLLRPDHAGPLPGTGHGPLVE